MPTTVSAPLLLVCSNIFMTFAWYAHLKHKEVALPKVILASWGIAFFEYLFMIPANRMGSNLYSAAQLKGMQEVITRLLVFGVLVLVPGAAAEVEPLGRLRADRGGGWLIFLE